VIVGDFQPQKSNSLRLSSYSSKNRAALPTLWVLIPAVLISVASFSSGFRDWHAVQDSLMTYMNYLERSTGSGHEKPWHYYITLLFWRQDGLIWSESMIGILGLVGMFYSLVGEFKNSPRQAFLVFLSVYTLVLFGVYSLLSYKTPWCILSAQYSLTLLAGAGAGWIWTWLDGRISRFFYKIAIGVGIYFLCGQSKFATDEYRADQRNPYVYSHTTTDLLRLVAEVKKIAAEKGTAFSAQVINHDSGWPLPWYWRTLPKIGYQMTPPEKLDSPLIIVDADQAPLVKAKLEGRDYDERGPYGLRPGHYLSLFVEKQHKPEPQPVAPVIPMLEPAATPAPAATSPSLTAPAGTISTAPTLMPSAPVLPALPAATTPAQP
jgi:predicted membrane-bound mannosyltransferase